jgi:hypothetical protein
MTGDKRAGFGPAYPTAGIACPSERGYNPGMSRTYSSRSRANRLITLGCLLMSVPCVLALLATALFYWPVVMQGLIH